MTPHERWVARRMMGRGWTGAEVMRVLGIPLSPPPRSPGVDHRTADSIERLWSLGLSVADISRATSVSKEGVRQYVESHPDECERRRPGRRRVEFDMGAAMDMRRRGRTYGDVAREMGVSRSTVAARLHEVGM